MMSDAEADRKDREQAAEALKQAYERSLELLRQVTDLVVKDLDVTEDSPPVLRLDTARLTKEALGAGATNVGWFGFLTIGDEIIPLEVTHPNKYRNAVEIVLRGIDTYGGGKAFYQKTFSAHNFKRQETAGFVPLTIAKAVFDWYYAKLENDDRTAEIKRRDKASDASRDKWLEVLKDVAGKHGVEVAEDRYDVVVKGARLRATYDGIEVSYKAVGELGLDALLRTLP